MLVQKNTLLLKTFFHVFWWSFTMHEIVDFIGPFWSRARSSAFAAAVEFWLSHAIKILKFKLLEFQDHHSVQEEAHIKNKAAEMY